jgi:hypothetical protein
LDCDRSRFERERDRRFLGGGELAAGSELPNISGFGLSLANCLTPVERTPNNPPYEDLRSFADLDRWLVGLV